MINAGAAELDAERLAALLEWHRAFPVSVYERHRNARIQRRQGNRNPCIDHPGWAERADLSVGLG